MKHSNIRTLRHSKDTELKNVLNNSKAENKKQVSGRPVRLTKEPENLNGFQLKTFKRSNNN